MPGPFEKWRLWEHAFDAIGTDLPDVKPSRWAAPRASKRGVITVRDIDEIMLQAFGTDAENETASLRIYGAMDSGAIEKLAQIDLILGAETFTEKFIDHGDVPAATAFFVADTYALTDNLVGASVPTASTTRITNHVLLPTLGYLHLLLLITATMTAATCGVIWRPTKVLVR